MLLCFINARTPKALILLAFCIEIALLSFRLLWPILLFSKVWLPPLFSFEEPGLLLDRLQEDDGDEGKRGVLLYLRMSALQNHIFVLFLSFFPVVPSSLLHIFGWSHVPCIVSKVNTVAYDDEVDDVWGFAADIGHHLPFSDIPWCCHIFCHLCKFTQVTGTITPGAILAPLHWNDHCSRKGSSWTNLLSIVTVISSERVGRLLLAAIMSHFRKINLFLGFHVGPKLRPKQLFWAFVSGP